MSLQTATASAWYGGNRATEWSQTCLTVGLYHHLDSCFHHQTCSPGFCKVQQKHALVSADIPPPALLPFPPMTPLWLCVGAVLLTVSVTGRHLWPILGIQSAVLFSTRASYGLILNVPINEKLCQTSSKKTPKVSGQSSPKYKWAYPLYLSTKCFPGHFPSSFVLTPSEVTPSFTPSSAQFLLMTI